MLRVFTAFSGYDSQCLALNVIQNKYDPFANKTWHVFMYELVGWSEIDKYAIRAHNALFPQLADRNYGYKETTKQLHHPGAVEETVGVRSSGG